MESIGRVFLLERGQLLRLANAGCWKIPEADCRLSVFVRSLCGQRIAQIRGACRSSERYHIPCEHILLAFSQLSLFAVQIRMLRTFVSCCEIQIGSEGIVDEFMRLAMRRHDLVKLWGCDVSKRKRMMSGGAGLHTIPELLLIL